MLERTRNVIQIIFVEFLAIVMLASVVATLFARRGILGCPPDLSYELGLFQIVVGILGLITFAWSLIGILRPRELPQMAFHRLLVNVGNVNATIPTGEAGRYVFPTSHPSYALVEPLIHFRAMRAGRAPIWRWKDLSSAVRHRSTPPLNSA